jgi:hypothetical protein
VGGGRVNVAAEGEALSVRSEAAAAEPADAATA